MTIYNEQIAVNAGGWVNLGTGPMTVESLGNASINVVVSDAEPPSGQIGQILSPESKSLEVTISAPVWAIVLSSGFQGTASVQVMLGNSRSANFTPTANSVSTSIGAANTDEQILAANALRTFLMIQNTSASATLLINLAGSTTPTENIPNPPIFVLNPGAILLLDDKVPVTAIHAQSASASATYTVLEG